MMTNTVPYTVAERLRTPMEAVAYRDAWLTEALADEAGIVRVLAEVARAQDLVVYGGKE